MYKFIKDINQENFLFGGLIYHHKEILDPEERDKEFEKMVKLKLTPSEEIKDLKKDFEDVEEFELEDIFAITTEIKRIEKSNSLNEFAMNSIMQYYGNKEEEHPLEEIYSDKNGTSNNIISDNIFIKKGIKILDSDIIIFISEKGMVGSVYDQGIKQELCIRYKYDKELCVNIGEVFDFKLINDFLDYKNHMEEINE